MINTGMSLLRMLHEDQTQGKLLSAYVGARNKRLKKSRGLKLLFVGALAGAIAWALVENFLADDSEDIPDGIDETAIDGAVPEDLTEEDIEALSEGSIKDIEASTKELENLEVEEPAKAKAVPLPNAITPSSSGPSSSSDAKANAKVESKPNPNPKPTSKASTAADVGVGVDKSPKTKNEETKEVGTETEKENKSYVSRMRDWFKGEPEKNSQQVEGKIGGQIQSSPGIPASKKRTAATATATKAPAGFKPKAQARPTDEIDKAIRGASTERVDYSTLYSIAGVESTFRPEVGATTSGAVGLFQFLPGTWKYLLTKHPELKYTLEDRKDPVKAANMAEIYIASIKKTLRTKLGREPYLVDIYMAYFLGPTGATNFLKALEEKPSQIGATLFSRAARANPGVFLGKNKKALTLAQIYENMGGKLSRYYADAKASVGTSAPQIALAPKDVEAKVLSPVLASTTKNPIPGSTSSTLAGVKPSVGTAKPKVSSVSIKGSTSVASLKGTQSSSPSPNPSLRQGLASTASIKTSIARGKVETQAEAQESSSTNKRSAKTTQEVRAQALPQAQDVSIATARPQPQATGAADEITRTNNVKVQNRMGPVAKITQKEIQDSSKQAVGGSSGGGYAPPSALMLVKRNGVVYALPQG